MESINQNGVKNLDLDIFKNKFGKNQFSNRSSNSPSPRIDLIF